MKKVILILLMAVSGICFSQSKDTRKMLAEIEGQWSVDDNSNVTYTRIVELPGMTAEEIYSRALNYFVYNYGSGQSVIQTQDKELGRIVAKGMYENVHIGYAFVTYYVDCWHIARVDVKEGKARIILTLTNYDVELSGGSGPSSYSSPLVSNSFPVNEKGMLKNVMGKSFYGSHLRANNSLNEIEKSLKEGNTSKEIENEKW